MRTSQEDEREQFVVANIVERWYNANQETLKHDESSDLSKVVEMIVSNLQLYISNELLTRLAEQFPQEVTDNFNEEFALRMDNLKLFEVLGETGMFSDGDICLETYHCVSDAAREFILKNDIQVDVTEVSELTLRWNRRERGKNPPSRVEFAAYRVTNPEELTLLDIRNILIRLERRIESKRNRYSPTTELIYELLLKTDDLTDIDDFCDILKNERLCEVAFREGVKLPEVIYSSTTTLTGLKKHPRFDEIAMKIKIR